MSSFPRRRSWRHHISSTSLYRDPIWLTPNRPRRHSSSNERPQEDLLVYYCLCGEFVLVCNKALELLAERPLDKSRVLRCSESEQDGNVQHAHIYKISASQGTGQMVRRYVCSAYLTDPMADLNSNMTLCAHDVGYLSAMSIPHPLLKMVVNSLSSSKEPSRKCLTDTVGNKATFQRRHY